MSLETKTNIEKLKHKGLCIPKFFNNLTIDNIDTKKIYVGKIIEIDKAKIEITEVDKECFPNCKLVQEGKSCDLTTKTIFAKIIESGCITYEKEENKDMKLKNKVSFPRYEQSY